MYSTKQCCTDQVKNACLVIDKNTFEIIDGNSEAQGLYGYDPIEFRSLKLTNLILKRDRDLLSLIVNEKQWQGGILRHQDSLKQPFLAYINFYPSPDNENYSILEVEPVTASRDSKEFTKANSLMLAHINLSKLGMVLWNEELKVIQWTHKAEEIFGYSFSEMVGQSIFDMVDIFTVESARMFKSSLFKILQSREDNLIIEREVNTRNGKVKWVRLNFSFIWDNNRINSAMCIVEDITASYYASLELRESELRYRTLFENSTEGVLIYKKGRFFDCNQRAAELFGCSKEEVVKHGPSYFSPPFQPCGRDSVTLAMHHIDTALKNGNHYFEWVHQKIDGTQINTEVSLSVIEVDGEKLIQALVKDVTARKKYEKQIIQSEKLFKSLFLNSPSAIVMVNARNEVELINKSFEDLFGYTQEDLFGKDIDRILVPKEEYDKVPKMPFGNGKGSSAYLQVVRYDKWGNPKNLILAALPVYLDGEPYKGFGIYVDITELESKKQSLKEALEEKNILMAEIHHRVKNNLALITSLFQLQAFYMENDPKVNRVLSDSVSRLRSIAIVHELLYQNESFSKIPASNYLQSIFEHVNTELGYDMVQGEAAPFEININQAIPLGLLTTELLLRLKSDRPSGNGTVKVSFVQKGDMIELQFDGLKWNPFENEDPHKSGNLSSQLIETLIQQLNGTVFTCDKEECDGKCIQGLRFKVSEASGSANRHMK